MKDRLFVLLQCVTPQHALSRLIGRLAECQVPFVKNTLIKLFIKHFKVNMQEAARPNSQDYRHFNDFFTRALQDDARIIDTTPNHLACPVDGAISQIGEIQHNQLFQAKGKTFDIGALLGGDMATAQQFHHGQFATIYLSPKDYHRIHMPCDGTLVSMTHVPGQLFSVNQATAAQVPNLFARNERAVAIFDTEFGPMAMVLVGAMIVASIETTWAGLISPVGKSISHWNYCVDTSQNEPIVLRKGEEMGRFKLGSTIILCLPKIDMKWNEVLTAGAPTKLGQMLASIES